MSIEVVASYIAPAAVVLAGMRWVASWMLKKFDARIAESEVKSATVAKEVKFDLETKHSANTQKLNGIEAQVKETNGTVSQHTEQLGVLQGEVKTLGAVVTALVGESKKP